MQVTLGIGHEPLKKKPTVEERLLKEAASLELMWKNDLLLKKQKPIKEKHVNRRRFVQLFGFD
jgi:hypothetical protein